MDKLKLAHEYLLKIMSNSPLVDQVDIEFAVSSAWSYARMMHSEKIKEDKIDSEQKRKEIREMLNAPNTFVEREGQHFDDVEEAKREGEYFFKLFCRQNGIDDSEALCEVDWSVAPQDTTGWKMKEDRAYWIDLDGWIVEEAPSFGFTGSHIVERPNGF